MPLTISLSAAIASTRDTWALTDGTVFSSPARSSYYVYVNAYKVDYQNALTQLTVANTTPNTAATWTIPYTIDGTYRVYYVALQAYNAGTTYAKYAAVYRSGAVYRSLQNGNVGQDTANTTWWELISDPATLANNKGEANESLNIDTLVYNRVFVANGQYTYGNFISDACSCTDCDESVTLRKYDIFSLLIREAQVADQRSEIVDGELICRKIQSSFIDCV